MSTPFDALPWSSLELNEPDIPWQHLRTFAEAAADSGDVRHRLLDELDTLTERRYAGEEEVFPNLADLAVLAVFALAAERMNGDGRREVAQSLLELLYRAGQEDDDFLLEAIELAAGKLGPDLVEPAIQLVEREGFDLDCWFHLFSLLTVVRSADEPIRERVLRFCRRIVQDSPDRFQRWSKILAPAMILAELGDTASIGLLRSIYRKSKCPDLKACIDRLEGEQEPLPDDLAHPWVVRPVEAWLPDLVKGTREYLAGGDDEPEDEYDESDSAYDRYGTLHEEFLDSAEFQVLPEPAREHAYFAVSSFLMYMWEHLGTPLEKLATIDVRELLLEIFPRKLSAQKEFFEQVPAVLVCFLRWLGQTGRHTNVGPLCAEVARLADEMLERSQDPRNWGLAKTAYMLAEQAGVDTSNPEAVTAYWNLRALTRHLSPASDSADEDESESDLRLVRPIHRGTERIGRNEPCPCGSGKKYKKCCGK